MAKSPLGYGEPGAQEQRFAVTVAFEIDEKQVAAFLPLMLENAQVSVRDEPGCLRFDVLLPSRPLAKPVVFLYEIYESRAAFDLHLASPHFLYFDHSTRDMILSKSVDTFIAHENGKTS